MALPAFYGAASDLDWREAVGECAHNAEPPETDQSGDEDDPPTPEEHFDIREFRQSLIDQAWKG